MSGMSGPIATSPVSSGGGGTFFEQHVGALFLALLLVRAPLPVLKDCQVEEIDLQAKHLGWRTDDVLVSAVRPDGVRRRLAAQVTRQFTISEKDETCRKTFDDFWAEDAIATPFVQGHLRNSFLEVEIGTSCAHCDSRMEIVVGSNLNYRIVEGGPTPLVFEPDVDWSQFRDPNIIDGY
ncbi:MAG: hypothetical protein JSW03_02135 [Candidatus Eiseniibacteriota bacterium]|nr:MAG: hypothetical protein JSW03_02135 [Candidatus Eisenbacteria bacterium]